MQAGWKVGVAIVLGGCLGVLAWALWPRADVSEARGPEASTSSSAAASPKTSAPNRDSDRARAMRALNATPARAAPEPGPVVHKSLSRDRQPAAGALGFRELLERDRPAVALMQDAFGPDAAVNEEADRCIAAWRERGGEFPANYDWTFRIAVVSDGKRGSVASIDADDWPEAFDAELRACYVRAYRAVWFPTEHAFEYVVSYPMCLKGG